MKLTAFSFFLLLGLLTIGGCLDDGRPGPIQGFDVSVVNNYHDTRTIDVWTSRMDDGPSATRDVAPNQGRGGWLFQCYEGRYLKVDLWDGAEQDFSKRIVETKKWVNFECHEYYTLVIDDQGSMTMYRGQQYMDNPPYENPMQDVPV